MSLPLNEDEKGYYEGSYVTVRHEFLPKCAIHTDTFPEGDEKAVIQAGETGTC